MFLTVFRFFLTVFCSLSYDIPLIKYEIFKSGSLIFVSVEFITSFLIVCHLCYTPMAFGMLTVIGKIFILWVDGQLHYKAPAFVFRQDNPNFVQ